MTEDRPWAQYISAQTLLEQVRNAAPFLFPLSQGHEHFRILAEAEQNLPESLEGYFQLCIACHHTTVATFVPTDVDTKIRGLLWRDAKGEAVRHMADSAFSMRHWDTLAISTRNTVLPGEQPVSGHNGEWLSVMLGAYGRLRSLGDDAYAERAAAEVTDELAREARIFFKALQTPGLELETLQLAMSVTHNLGDVDQAISFWERRVVRDFAGPFHRLAHENTAPFSGIFQHAALLYRELLASEGHRHYPLRPIKGLRVSAGLLLPLGPFFDDWGGIIATHPSLDAATRAEVLDALIRGCRKVANQAGYYRAIAGFREASNRNFEQALQQIPNAARREFRDADLQRKITVPRASFESTYKKRVIALRDRLKSRTA